MSARRRWLRRKVARVRVAIMPSLGRRTGERIGVIVGGVHTGRGTGGAVELRRMGRVRVAIASSDVSLADDGFEKERATSAWAGPCPVTVGCEPGRVAIRNRVVAAVALGVVSVFRFFCVDSRAASPRVAGLGWGGVPSGTVCGVLRWRGRLLPSTLAVGRRVEPRIPAVGHWDTAAN